MIRPDWNSFKAKFSENPQDAFEWFCYLLICREFDKTKGIFRYINQSRIETNPIEFDDQVIGWQAKFYETTLSQHKADMIKGLDGCHEEYPDVNKMLFFTNQEWGQGQDGGDSQVKVDVEAKAKQYGIEIVWRQKSFFESPFVCQDNDSISSHFFTPDSGALFAAINRQITTKAILDEIKTSIPFAGKDFEVDRSEVIRTVLNTTNKIIVINGFGGVGKTSVIKRLFRTIEDQESYLCLFRANEFYSDSINAVFGSVDPTEFARLHQEDCGRTVVFDSAEKLAEVNDLTTFRRTLRAFTNAGWRVIFTTRNHHAEDLQYIISDMVGQPALKIQIPLIGEEELKELSSTHEFVLPRDERLLDLIRIPFYLSEYLSNLAENQELDYQVFKGKLWSKIIMKGNSEREQCFLRIASSRARSGSFFINFEHHEPLLSEFHKDGVLGYTNSSYFIAHDIFEEWALEKYIQGKYLSRSSNDNFFEQLGNAFAVRRAFRRWLYDKLQTCEDEYTQLICCSIREPEISQIWRDDLLISLLKYDNARAVLDQIKNEILLNDLELLKRLFFLLRLACKEIDPALKTFSQKNEKNSFTYYPTNPVGGGWPGLIGFVYDNLDKIGLEKIWFVMPALNDWASKTKDGLTTRQAGLLAIKWYERSLSEDVFFSNNEDSTKRLFQTILFCVNEIKNELKSIYDQIIQSKWCKHRDPYNELIEYLLTSLFEPIECTRLFPKEVRALCDLSWYEPPSTGRYPFEHFSHDLEQDFGLRTNHMDYYPSSAYQTPIYWLLKFSLSETIEFIVQFVNKTTENYANSELAKNEIEQIDIKMSDGKSVQQYASNRLWGMYRSMFPVPNVLESMHMALEKALLEVAESATAEQLEKWLYYLIENSNSVSITSVVLSVVLAYPEKAFNVAAILLRTKEVLLYDTSRMVRESSCKMLYSMGIHRDYENRMRQNERLSSCNDKHRSKSLEHQIVTYQFFLPEGTEKSVANQRQKILWSICDELYSELDQMDQNSEETKTYRMFLARMDRRKMNPTTEEVDGGVAINFNPQLDMSLQEISKQSTARSKEFLEHSQLKLWASYRFDGNKRYEQYEQYENDPREALKEAKDIIKKLEGQKRPNHYSLSVTKREAFYLANHATPSLVCSVLIRDFAKCLSSEEILFCANLIIEFSSQPLGYGYQYQVGDGVINAISTLPAILAVRPDKSTEIAEVTFFNLLDGHSTGHDGTMADYVASNMSNAFWKDHFELSWSLFSGYLMLKGEYEDMRQKTLMKSRRDGQWDSPTSSIIEEFTQSHEELIGMVVNGRIVEEKIPNLPGTNIRYLSDALAMLPVGSKVAQVRSVLRELFLAIADHFKESRQKDDIRYSVHHRLFDQIARQILSLPTDMVPEFIYCFKGVICPNKWVADLLKSFIYEVDQSKQTVNFWKVWNELLDSIFSMTEKGDGHWYAEEIIKTYLLATIQWNEGSTHWDVLTIDHKNFFTHFARERGYCPSVLHSLARLVETVGKIYTKCALVWFSDILSKHADALNSKTNKITIMYLEDFCRKFVLANRGQIKKTAIVKNQISIVLDFLVNKGSVTGFMLRESLL